MFDRSTSKALRLYGRRPWMRGVHQDSNDRYGRPTLYRVKMLIGSTLFSAWVTTTGPTRKALDAVYFYLLKSTESIIVEVYEVTDYAVASCEPTGLSATNKPSILEVTRQYAKDWSSVADAMTEINRYMPEPASSGTLAEPDKRTVYKVAKFKDKKGDTYKVKIGTDGSRTL